MDNTSPVISVEIVPGEVNPGEEIKITAETSDDAENVTAYGKEETKLTRSNNAWAAGYSISKNENPGTTTMRFKATDHGK